MTRSLALAYSLSAEMRRVSECFCFLLLTNEERQNVVNRRQVNIAKRLVEETSLLFLNIGLIFLLESNAIENMSVLCIESCTVCLR